MKGYLIFLWRFQWYLNSEAFQVSLNSEAFQVSLNIAIQNKTKYVRYYLISYFSHFFPKKSQNRFLRPKIPCHFCLICRFAFRSYVCTMGKMKNCQTFALTTHLVFFRINTSIINNQKNNLFRNRAYIQVFWGLNDTC